MFSKSFFDLSNNIETGEILLVTSKGVYFRLGKCIFQLTDDRWGATPIGIGIDDVDFLISCDIKAGQPVKLQNGSLHFCGAVLQVQEQNYTLPSSFCALKPELITRCAATLQCAGKERGVSSLCTPLLLSDGDPEQFVNSLCQVAYPPLVMLVQALQDRQPIAVTSSVTQLLGLGVGLTPSLDDVILGILYGLLRIAPDDASTAMLTEAVRAHAAEYTNEISAAYLLAVANGAPFERLDDLLMGLSGQIPLDIEPILEIGSSSGSEMLLGLLIAAKIIYL